MLQKSSIEQTRAFFFDSPTRGHSLMEISTVIGIAHTSIKQNLKELVKDGLIAESIEKKGKRKFPVYTAERNAKKFQQQKIIHNLSALLDSLLIDFLEDKLAPKAIVLFGSYRRGEDIETSDINIFVECKQEDIDLKQFEKKLKRKIEIHFQQNFLSYIKELRNNILNGIVLRGFLEGYK